MKSFERLLSLLSTIPDPRRAEGKLYQLPHILLFELQRVARPHDFSHGRPPKLMIHIQPWETFFRGKVTRLMEGLMGIIRSILFAGAIASYSNSAKSEILDLECSASGHKSFTRTNSILFENKSFSLDFKKINAYLYIILGRADVIKTIPTLNKYDTDIFVEFTTIDKIFGSENDSILRVGFSNKRTNERTEINGTISEYSSRQVSEYSSQGANIGNFIDGGAISKTTRIYKNSETHENYTSDFKISRFDGSFNLRIIKEHYEVQNIIYGRGQREYEEITLRGQCSPRDVTKRKF